MVCKTSDMVDALARVNEVQHPAWPTERQTKTRDGIISYFAKLTPEQRDQWVRSIALHSATCFSPRKRLVSDHHPCWASMRPRLIKAQLQLPAHLEVAALVALGYPDETGLDQHRLPSNR
jgi:hypothetical protein